MKKIVSLLLCFAMLFSLGTVAFASGSKEINYVSLGDSTTMGYFVGTYDDDYDKRHYDENGNAHISNYSVSTLFSNYLTEQGYTVNTTDLTTLGMRTKELHMILDEDYFKSMNPQITVHDGGRVGLVRSTWYLLHMDTYMFYKNTYYYDPDCHATGSDLQAILDDTYADINSTYNDAIAEADIITYDLLNGDALYFVDRISSLISGDDDYDTYYGGDTLESVMREAKRAGVADSLSQLSEKLTSLLSSAGLDLGTIAQVVDAALYTFANDLVNFSATVELIHESNPNAKLIVISPYNPVTDFTITLQGITINLGKLWSYLVEAINSYLIHSDKHSSWYVLADCSGGIENCIADFAQGNIMSEAYDGFRGVLAQRLYNQTTPNRTIRFASDTNVAANIAAACQSSDVDIVSVLADGIDANTVYDAMVKNTEELTATDKSQILIYMLVGDSRGIGIHPSADGYQQKTDAVIQAYEKDLPATSTYLVRAVKVARYLIINAIGTMKGDQTSQSNLHTLFTRLFTPVVDLRALLSSLQKD